MNIIDIIAILIIILFGYLGKKKGFVKSIVSFLGLILVFIIAFIMKNPIADWLSLNLPFFNFTGSFKGATILNVIIYQLIAFILVFSILMTIYQIVVRVSGLVERLLKVSFILSIPTKIGGIIVGVLEGMVVVLISIVVLSLPVLKFNLVEDSLIRKYLYDASPVVGKVTGNLNVSISEIMELKDKFESDDNKEDFNLSCLDILLKHKILKKDLASKLVNGGKLKVDENKANNIINKYE